MARRLVARRRSGSSIPLQEIENGSALRRGWDETAGIASIQTLRAESSSNTLSIRRRSHGISDCGGNGEGLQKIGERCW